MPVSKPATAMVEPGSYSGVLIEISKGIGGKDADEFVADLARMYSNFAMKQGWSMEELRRHADNGQEPRLVLLRVLGEDAYQTLRHETGVHRLQRGSARDQGRVHTSTASVVVMPIPGDHLRREKIRTYNFPEDEARDHRHKVRVREVGRILNGDLDIILGNLPEDL